MYLINKLMCCLALLLFASDLAAQTLTLEEYAREKMIEHGVAGMSIGTLQNGELQNVIYLGVESTATKLPVSKQSIFQVGSISKSVTAWVAMTLVRDGKLDLDKPVSHYLTRWRIPSSGFDIEQVTLRRLLSHTAGLRLHGYSGFPEGESLPSIEESLSGKTNGAGKVELFQAPGLGFSYSGGGYTLIQLLIEEVSGIPFSEYAKLSVLDPLGMHDSSYQPNEKLLKRRVEPHGYSLNPIVQHDFRAQAAASLHTTVNDLTRFVSANTSGNSLLEKGVVAMMHSPVADAGFAETGLGFFVAKEGRLVGHGGANIGWRAELQFNPSTGDGLVITTNSDGAGLLLKEIKCYWDTQLIRPVLSAACSEREAHTAKFEALAKMIVWLIASIIMLVFLVLVWALLTSRAMFALPRTVIKRVGLLIIVSLTLFIVVFLYTPLGAFLLTGFKSLFATIHYAEKWQAAIASWVCLGMFTAWVPFLLIKTDNKERS